MLDRSLTPIEYTTFKECFEDIQPREVFLLGKEGANKLWQMRVDKNATSYFNLPDDSWVVASRNERLGTWIEAYNSDNNETVSDILKKEFSWSDDMKVWFCVSKEIVFETSWKIFLRHWDCFIAADEDCPILLGQEESTEQALYFRAIGDMYKIGC